MSDFDSARLDFPLFAQRHPSLVYLDSAATTQKPQAVLDALRHYYEEENANIHRGVHRLAQLATASYEKAREVVADFCGAQREEVIFTAGTTDGINQICTLLARSGRVGEGDLILLSGLEHHSNIVPWQMLCEQVGSNLGIIPVLDDGTLDLEAYAQLLEKKPKVLSLTQVSNAFGTVNPIAEMVAQARQAGALTVIDGAQHVAHGELNFAEIQADFYVFSGHKLYGPTGIGVLLGRHELLEILPPVRGGGEMIAEVRFEGTTYAPPPLKYEAGTPHIAGAIGLAAACQYVNNLGKSAIAAHEKALLQRAAEGLESLGEVHLFGPAERCGALSFEFPGVHHYDLGTLLDQSGVAVRTGHHCCQPLMARFGITGTTRASVALYNTPQDIDTFLEATTRALRLLA